MTKKHFVLALLFPLAAFAAQEKTANPILISHAKGIVLVPNDRSLLPASELRNVDGLEVINIDLPGPVSALQRRLEPIYDRGDLTRRDLIDMRNEIAKFYEDYYHPFVMIEIPAQEVSTGVVQLVVTEARVSAINVEGNCRWSKSICCKESLAIHSGDYINSRVMTGDLNFYNRNPFRDVSAIYEPGEADGTTDIIFLVQDRTPFQVYAGVDNTGLDQTGRVIEYVGCTWGNFMGLEHMLSYQYTVSTFKKLQAHTAQYIAPLSWKHVINIFGGYASIHPKVKFPTQSSSGFSAQASFRYTIPLLPLPTVRHEISWGFDFKRTNSDLLFSSDAALAPFHQPVNLTQLMLGYVGTFSQPNYAIDYSIYFFGSPVRWVSDQTNKDYNALRPGAKNTWFYSVAEIAYKVALPWNLVYSASLEGQYTTTTLLPSEEFGLGGYATVRGYDERILNQDNAVLFITELHSPAWAVFTKKDADTPDAISFLAFFDASYGEDKTAYPGQKRHEWLAGVGPGVRYVYGSYLSCRLDWGFKLHKGPVIGHSYSKIHFGVIGSY